MTFTDQIIFYKRHKVHRGIYHKIYPKAGSNNGVKIEKVGNVGAITANHNISVYSYRQTCRLRHSFLFYHLEGQCTPLGFFGS